MDNVTHALVGAAMAECAAPTDAARSTRTVFVCAGILAANAPDVDLLYTGIIEEPLGYLLHHRGHSHTLPVMAALGLLIWLGVRSWPRAAAAIVDGEMRAIALIAAAIVSHLTMDAANGYGTHAFYPVTSRWFYGDAVFVLEPWLWAILGATIVANARRVARVLVGLLMVFLLGVVIALGVLPVGVSAVMALALTTAALVTRGWTGKRRAAAALVATATIFVGMAGVSRIAKGEARRLSIGPESGDVIDVVADANPGAPWCWGVLVLQRTPDADRLVARRATLSLVPSLRPAASCASARLSARWTIGVAPSDAVIWHRRWEIDLAAIRTLRRDNCRVRAWLQFGRIPFVSDGVIRDLRFENPVGQNFTPMTIDEPSRGCPAFLTNWVPPRLDVLGP